MPANESQQTPESEEPSGQKVSRRERNRASKRVTEARALAQRAKLDAQAEARQEPATKAVAPKQRSEKQSGMAHAQRAGGERPAGGAGDLAVHLPVPHVVHDASGPAHQHGPDGKKSDQPGRWSGRFRRYAADPAQTRPLRRASYACSR